MISIITDMYICKKCLKEFEEQRRFAFHMANHAKSEKRVPIIFGELKVNRVCKKCNAPFKIIHILKNGIEIIPSFEKRFCSLTCANSHVVSIDTRKNISEGAKKRQKNTKEIYECKSCNKQIVKTKTGYCKACLFKSPEYRKSISDSVKKRVANGTHNGWQSRNIISYPEKFFIQVLKNNGLEKGIDYEFNYTLNKSRLGIKSAANYFLDFYFSDKNLDLEIDGSQHINRIEHDEERDKLLIENGFKVYRIKWKSINNDAGKAYIKSEIDKFFKYYGGKS